MELEVKARVAVGHSSKTFELSLSRNYVSHWGVIQAIRELIQNGLDSESPFVYEFIDEGDGRSALRLNSEFSTLTPATLLLGTTSKSNGNFIGSFGEGYKIALLVLTREGYDVEVLNGNLLWRPRFRHSRQFNDELLVIDETDSPHKSNKGLTFIVHGLEVKDVQEVRNSCLLMQQNVGEVRATECGDILLDQPKKLYVGGLFICETELKHGYNIKPEHMRLERDRQTVYSWELESITTRMWFDTKDATTIAKMIDEQAPDVGHARYDCPEIVKEECYRIFRERHPGALVAENQSQFKEMVEAGLTKTVVVGGGMYHAISSYAPYRREMPRMAEQTPTAVLNLWLAKNRGEMRTKAIVAFKELIIKSKRWSA